MTQADTLTKETFILTGVSIIRNFLNVIVDVRNTCQIMELIDDMSVFCEENCESKKLISRLTKNFTQLSKLSQEIINMIYDDRKDDDTVSIIEEV